jgi:hypothetical protein
VATYTQLADFIAVQSAKKSYPNVSLEEAVATLHAGRHHNVEMQVLKCPCVDKPLLVALQPNRLDVPQ